MSHLPPDHHARLARAHLALDGLSVGDAFGERYFGRDEFIVPLIEQRLLMDPPWHWTDDTAMALSIVEVLATHGRIEQDALAAAFASRYAEDPRRGYGGTAHEILRDIGAGKPWAEVSGDAFDGSGSKGNGGAMRVAPVGAYFADDLARVVDEAAASAAPTHAHPDGQAGAIAVAVAAAFAATHGSATDGRAMLVSALDHTPAGDTRDGLARALQLRDRGMSTQSAAAILGSGRGVISSDTVPFSLYCASLHLHDFEAAMWTTVAGLGDRDTTCAIVGGIVALSVGQTGLPKLWLDRREALPVVAS